MNAIRLQRRWMVILLLFFVQIVNFADKAVMGLAAVPVMRDLGLTPQQYGLVASSFYSLYAITGLIVALVFAPKVPPRVILLVLLAVWATAQLPILFAASFAMLIACRTGLGAAEGSGTPTVISAAHEWFAPQEHSLPTAIVMFGTTIGPLFAAPLLSHVIIAFGWRAAFGVCSALGFLALATWWFFGTDGPDATIAVKSPPSSDASARAPADSAAVWTDRTIIGSLIGGFCAYWSIGFSVSWLAPFLRTALGFDTLATGWLLSLIFVGQGVIQLGASYASHRLTQRGLSSRIARGWFVGIAQLASAAAFFATTLVDNPAAKIALILLATGLPHITFTLGPPIVSEVTPPAQRNRTLGVILSVITVAGILAPYATGLLVGGTPGPTGYGNALLLAASVLVIGGIASLAMLHPEVSRRRLAGDVTA